MKDGSLATSTLYAGGKRPLITNGLWTALLNCFRSIAVTCVLLDVLTQGAFAAPDSKTPPPNSNAARDILFQSDTPPPAANANKIQVVPPQPRPLSPSLSLPARMKVALAYDRKKAYRDVVETLKPINDKLGRQGLLLLAKAYGGSGDHVNEMRTLELILAKNARDYVVKTQLANVQSAQKKSEDAIANYTEAREINKKYEPAYRGLLSEYEKSGNTYEARNIVIDMIKTFGPRPKFYTDLCRLYSNDGFLEKAVESCGIAIEKNPNEPLNYMYLGVCIKDKEEPEKAMAILLKASKRFPQSEPLQSVVAGIEFERKNYAAAYQYYKLAVKANPKSGIAQVGLANASFEMQKYEESAQAFEKACHIDKRFGKEFRTAGGKLRGRKESKWQNRFDDGLIRCQ